MKLLDLYHLRQKPKLGRMAKKSTQTGEDALKEIANQLLNLMNGLKGAGKNASIAIGELTDSNTKLSAGLGIIADQYDKVNKRAEAVVKSITFLEEHNSELNKTLKISSVAAQGAAENFRKVGRQIGFSDKTTTKYVKAVKDMHGALVLIGDSTTHFTDATIQGQTIMQESIGLSAEQAAGFEQYSNSLGVASTTTMIALKSMSEGIATKLGDATKAGAIQAEIMGEIGSLSEEVQMQYSRMPGNLEVAVLKAKALGMTMENLHQTGEKLLDVESSVGDELEYQLLSGQRLVKNGKSLTNAYRMAFMEGDATKQADIMNDILKSQGDTLRKNYMARKKMSELLGIDEKTLARSLNKQKVAAELGANQLLKLEGEDLTNEIARLEKEFNGGEKDREAYMKKLNEFKKATDTRTTLEKTMEDGLTKIADAISQRQGNISVGATSDKAMEFYNGKGMQSLRTMFDGMQEQLGYYKIVSDTTAVYTNTIQELQTSTLKGFSGIEKAVTKGVSLLDKGFKAATLLKYKTEGGAQDPTTITTPTEPTYNPVVPDTVNASISTPDMNKFGIIVADAIKTALANVTIKSNAMWQGNSLNGPWRT